MVDGHETPWGEEKTPDPVAVDMLLTWLSDSVFILLASPFPGGETEAEGPSDEPGIRTRKLQSWIQTRPLASLGSYKLLVSWA